jgi:hypothetical protein
MAKNGLASGKVRYTNSENKIEEIYVNKISLKELAEIINLEIVIEKENNTKENPRQLFQKKLG